MGTYHDIVVRLPFDRDAARLARDLVVRQLLDSGAAREAREDASLVVHELVVNAVLHGRPDQHHQIEFTSRVAEGRLWVSVVDCGTQGHVVVRPPNAEAPDGRGLAIVEALCESWSVDRTQGTRVSALLALEPR